VQRAPGLPCALYIRGQGDFWQSSGASRREKVKLYLPKNHSNSTLAPMVNRVLTSPYLWWFDPLPVAPSVPRPQLKVLAF
jgi:hypothetical protein